MDEKAYGKVIAQVYGMGEANRLMAAKRSFFHYVLSLLRKASFYRFWQKGLTYFRRFRLIAVCLRVAASILAFLQTGALVLLGTLLFLVVLPIFLSLMLGVLLTALLESKRTDRRLLRESESARVCVLFMNARPSPFFCWNAAELAARGERIVLVVSPYLLARDGLRKGRFYCTARAEAHGVYLIRRYYFFHLKRKLLSARNTLYVY